MSEEDQELWLQGAPVSEGIAIGVPFFLTALEEDSVPEFPIAVGEIEGEIARYRQALFSSREDLERLQVDLATEGSSDVAVIIDTHIQMLDDPLITTHMEERIRNMRQNTESVFRSVINEYEKRFSQTCDSFFQQRLIDVMDVSNRILEHLCPKQKISLIEIPLDSIVFAKELNPSCTAEMQASRVRAVVTERGGGNSHAALIARAKGIPFVASIDIRRLHNAHRRSVIVDGMTGEVILNPLPETLLKYSQLAKRLKRQYQLLEKESHLGSKTLDGHEIRLFVNISSLNDLDSLNRQGIEGIGLYRSEYLILENPSLFYSEEGQYQAYVHLLEKARGLPTAIRVFDLGGDKHFDLKFKEQKEFNPLSGYRGIRFLLRFKKFFKTQLRALLRASFHGDMRLLLPLITDISELRISKKIIEMTREELAQEGLPFKEQIPLGCMIEVPSAVLISEQLARESDFFSIGTNDLVQYVLGVDRSSPLMNDFSYPAHPAVIRLIKVAVEVAKREQRSISICGEMASNPLFISLIIGLGFEEISCSPRSIPTIKRTIRRCRLSDSIKLADEVLSKATSSEISDLLLKEHRRLFPEDP
jgi:phosphoenolpyruvate-protein phosphotransferase (PTS system enzyme I)